MSPTLLGRLLLGIPLQLATESMRLLRQDMGIGESRQVPFSVSGHLIHGVGECEDGFGLSSG